MRHSQAMLMRIGLYLSTWGLLGCQAVSGLGELAVDQGLDAGSARLGRSGDGTAGSAGRSKNSSNSGTNTGASTASGSGGASASSAASGSRAAGGSDSAGGNGAAAPGGSTHGMVPTMDDADAGSPECSTRITYGSAWIRGADHASSDWDETAGLVTWDGNCEIDGSGNSFAELSNGWKPFFQGAGSCVIALDVRGSCAPAGGCSTRIAYGPSWSPPEGHAALFDDVTGVVTTDGVCVASGEQSYQVLSNGWQPHFTGSAACAVALRYSQCGGLFQNPVLAATNCHDPGVLRDANQYVLTCAEGGSEFPIRTSTDLVHWAPRGNIFSPANAPRWATSDFWAPEIHRVGDRFVAYFSARQTSGAFAIGAAESNAALGPFTETGAPLVRDAQGAIQAHEFEAEDGTRYLLWKVDGNAVAAPTPIQIQPLTDDGLALTGSATTLISNSLAWEGRMIENPWLIFEAGYYYLFYSGNGFTDDGFAIGVARSAAVTGPFTKAPAPILVTGGAWVGPSLGSVVRAPGGAWVLVYDALPVVRDDSSPRQLLLTRLGWQDGWPTALGAPSSISQPLP